MALITTTFYLTILQGVQKLCNAYQMINLMRNKFTYVIVLDRNFEILILVKPGRDLSVTTAKVSSTN